MARPSTGNVRFDRRRKNPPFELRFQAYGNRQCVKLGTAEQGWTWERAQRELENVLVEVRRGIWKPAEPEPEPAPVADENPVFHNFASTWFEDNKGEWTENTRLDYQWQISVICSRFSSTIACRRSRSPRLTAIARRRSASPPGSVRPCRRGASASTTPRTPPNAASSPKNGRPGRCRRYRSTRRSPASGKFSRSPSSTA